MQALTEMEIRWDLVELPAFSPITHRQHPTRTRWELRVVRPSMNAQPHWNVIHMWEKMPSKKTVEALIKKTLLGIEIGMQIMEDRTQAAAAPLRFKHTPWKAFPRGPRKEKKK